MCRHPTVMYNGVETIDIFTTSHLFSKGIFPSDAYHINGSDYWNNLCKYCKGVFKFSDQKLRSEHYQKCYKFNKMFSQQDGLNYNNSN